MAPLLGVSLLARIALTANATALTMYVVLGLGMSYAAAGGVAAALTAGVAVGGPLLGRVLDRRGPRVVLAATAAFQVLFWLSVPFLQYGLLLGASFAAGLLMVPAPLVTRQAIAAMTAAGGRRAAFALEAVQGELSYMVGPPIVILCAAQTSPSVVAWGVGAAIAAGGAGIALLDPPLRADAEEDAGTVVRPRRREWLGPRLVAVLVMAFGATMLLGGTDLAIVATLREAGEVSWAAVVVAVYGVASIAGGLVYGALPPGAALPTAARAARSRDRSRRAGPRLALVVRGRRGCGAARCADPVVADRRGEPAGSGERAGRGDRAALLGVQLGFRGRGPHRRGGDRRVRAGKRLRGRRADRSCGRGGRWPAVGWSAAAARAGRDAVRVERRRRRGGPGGSRGPCCR